MPVKYTPNTRGRQPVTRDPRAGSHDYSNHDGPIVPGGDPRGNTIDYGPHKPRADYSSFGSPRWSDRDPAFDATPQQLAADAAARQPYIDRRNEMLGGDQAYQQAKAAGDLKGQIAAMTRLKQQGQQDRFVAQGGTPETWQNRFDPNNNWPVPRSPSGNYQYGPGRPGPTPPNLAQSAPAGGVRRGATPATAQSAGPVAVPPMQNSMMEGYLGGGAGQVSGGQGGQFGGLGSWLQQAAGGMPGGFNPEGPYGGVMSPEAMAYRAGQSKSGMGQSPMDFSRPMTGTYYGDPSMATQGRNFPPIGLPTGPRSPIGGGPPPSWPMDPSGGSQMNNLMALFNMQQGGLNASSFGSGNFGNPLGPEMGMNRFYGGYRPPAGSGMMYPY